MPERERFRRLEPDEPPAGPRGPAPGSDRRFAHLEVGETPVASPEPEIPEAGAVRAPPDTPPAAPGQSAGTAAGAQGPPGYIEDRHLTLTFTPRDGARDRLTLVFNGRRYASDDPEVPRDFRLLMDRILEDGYGPELFAMWQAWRKRERTLRRGQPESERERIEWELDTLAEEARQRREELTDRAVWLGLRVVPVVLVFVFLAILRACWR